ncbi:hypothetical protein D3C77_712160 [compost metagenome]
MLHFVPDADHADFIVKRQPIEGCQRIDNLNLLFVPGVQRPPAQQSERVVNKMRINLRLQCLKRQFLLL